MRNFEVLTLNIGNPSIERARKQADWLSKRHEDVFILTETKKSEGCSFIEEYFLQFGQSLLTIDTEARYFVYFPKSITSDLGVMIISKLQIIEEFNIFPRDSIYYSRFAGCVIDFQGKLLSIIGTYIPSRDRSDEKVARKKDFCISIAQYLTKSVDRSTIIGGDFNIVSRTHIPHYTTFFEWEYNFYDFFEKHNFIDVFKLMNPNANEYSWVGRTNDGYRYDYIFTTEDLIGSVQNCAFIHETRKNSISDHSALKMVLSPTPRTVDPTPTQPDV